MVARGWAAGGPLRRPGPDLRGERRRGRAAWNTARGSTLAGAGDGGHQRAGERRAPLDRRRRLGRIALQDARCRRLLLGVRLVHRGGSRQLPDDHAAASTRLRGQPTTRAPPVVRGLGWPTGFEPVTFGATIRCSAVELRPPRKRPSWRPPSGRAARATAVYRSNASCRYEGRPRIRWRPARDRPATAPDRT